MGEEKENSLEEARKIPVTSLYGKEKNHHLKQEQ